MATRLELAGHHWLRDRKLARVPPLRHVAKRCRGATGSKEPAADLLDCDRWLTRRSPIEAGSMQAISARSNVAYLIAGKRVAASSVDQTPIFPISTKRPPALNSSMLLEISESKSESNEPDLRFSECGESSMPSFVQSCGRKSSNLLKTVRQRRWRTAI